MQIIFEIFTVLFYLEQHVLITYYPDVMPRNFKDYVDNDFEHSTSLSPCECVYSYVYLVDILTF